MSDVNCGDIVLESENKRNQYRLSVTDDGKLVAVRLFHNPDGSWKPKGSDYKVLANIGVDGRAFGS
jgi:hypothetical protein